MNPVRGEELRVLLLLNSGCRTTRDLADRMLIDTGKALRLCYRLERRGYVERLGSVILQDAAKNTSHAWRVSLAGKRFLGAKR